MIHSTEEDPLDRELQSKELARIMAEAYPMPAIFLGYVITKVKAPRRELHFTSLDAASDHLSAAPYEILTTDGKMHDIDGEDTERWLVSLSLSLFCPHLCTRCEYILFRGMYRTGYGRMARGTITDTELQIGKFVLPPHGTGVLDESHEARYRRSFKEALPRSWVRICFFLSSPFEQMGFSGSMTLIMETNRRILMGIIGMYSERYVAFLIL